MPARRDPKGVGILVGGGLGLAVSGVVGSILLLLAVGGGAGHGRSSGKLGELLLGLGMGTMVAVAVGMAVGGALGSLVGAVTRDR